MARKSEFTAHDDYTHDHTSALRWIVSHYRRHKRFVGAVVLLYFASLAAYSLHSVLIGQVAAEIADPSGSTRLLWLSLAILGVLLTDGIANLLGSYAGENAGTRLEAGARRELYANLLGKSQTFHNRQRVGDIMARATDDVGLLNGMTVPGLTLSLEAVFGFAIPLTLIALTQWRMLAAPLVFLAAHIYTVRHYTRQLNPVQRAQREQFGKLNARLEETITGIEVVKASAQEPAERRVFTENASRLRDWFIKQGGIEARYLPLLLYAVMVGITFLHGMWLYQHQQLSLPSFITVMGLLAVMRWPTVMGVWTFSLVQSGLVGAERLLKIIRTETEMDENTAGHVSEMRGEIEFDRVSFGYEGRPLLREVSFHIRPGQTIAIVGQTGSGKTALTQLVNRIYDAEHGAVRIDGVDVRAWSMDALRSQIGKIEQDIFLFSRTIAENIAFGKPEATPVEIEEAARAAQAHDFITAFKDGYQTMVGERGVTLSGGQKQRIALARAFLSNPRILILDDSTSAIDSATEDEIQKALRHIQRGRTTLLITHRLSQIRWADHILVLDEGRLAASGTHDELLRRSPHYRRIFARYDIELPPLQSPFPNLQVLEQPNARLESGD